MTEEAANKKAATEARKQRDLKKFGKQVQIAKLQERDKAKRETLGKIDLLKRSTSFSDPLSMAVDSFCDGNIRICMRSVTTHHLDSLITVQIVTLAIIENSLELTSFPT